MRERKRGNKKSSIPAPLVEQANASQISSLSDKQELALEKLAAGLSISKAAEAAGVTRQTVYSWLDKDPNFAAAFNLWRREMIASNRARGLSMSELALDTVANAMEAGNAHVALQVAKATGALAPQQPGQTDPQFLSRRRMLRQGQRDHKLRKAEESLIRLTGGDPDADLHNILYIEGVITNLLALRQDAIWKESPEDRAARFATPVDYTLGYNRPQTLQLFELFDQVHPPSTWSIHTALRNPDGSLVLNAAGSSFTDPKLVEARRQHPPYLTGPSPDPAAAPLSASACPDSTELVAGPVPIRPGSSPDASPCPPFTPSPDLPLSPSPDPPAPTIKTIATRVAAPAPPVPRRKSPPPAYPCNDFDDELNDPAWKRII
jgi:hypothetical protein